jgi:hypothetical protein
MSEDYAKIGVTDKGDDVRFTRDEEVRDFPACEWHYDDSESCRGGWWTATVTEKGGAVHTQTMCEQAVTEYVDYVRGGEIGPGKVYEVQP